ncbi:MAG: hypothetical protein NTY53_21605 [Kiritimatiellaeota bacterium]|nr:hypothetical protein [Kiritimatiellota bacterium]
MSLIAKDKGPSIEPIPAGVHVAVCYGVVDLGTQFTAKFNKSIRKILMLWEIPGCRGDFDRDGQKVSLPRAISRRYTLSLSEKANLRRDLESWRGKKFTAQELAGFDVQAVLGAACQMQIVHEAGSDGKTYAQISAIMALPKGVARPKLENPKLVFTFEGVTGIPELPATMPDWIREIIAASAEWQRLSDGPPITGEPGRSTAPAKAEDADDLPF